MAYALLLFIPLSLVLRYIADAPAGWVFLTSAAAITVLAVGFGAPPSSWRGAPAARSAACSTSASVMPPS
jgi:hypothetical protein